MTIVVTLRVNYCDRFVSSSPQTTSATPEEESLALGACLLLLQWPHAAQFLCYFFNPLWSSSGDTLDMCDDAHRFVMIPVSVTFAHSGTTHKTHQQFSVMIFESAVSFTYKHMKT